MAKILVLDDSPTIRAAIRVHLGQDNHEVIDALNGNEALRLCRTMPIQLVISDIVLPGMSGIDFVKILRADENPALQNIPIILVTAVPLRAEGIRAGANAFLPKPVDGTKLRATITSVLNQGMM